MASTVAEGPHRGATIVEGEYGTMIVTGPPLRAEDPTKYAVKKYVEGDIQKRFGWTREQIDQAIAFVNFPTGRIRKRSYFGSWKVTQIRFWSATEVEAWEERARALNLLK
jgi:hypothetical protein